MEISVRTQGRVGLFRVEGPVREGAHVHLRDALIQCIDEGQSKFVVDMTRADSLDSAALGELVACLKRARQDGGDLKLVVRPHGIVHELLQIMRLDRIFQIFGDEKEATAAFTVGLN
ncbi:MAG: STAS domain-containing protein [Acidobacteria bacterium]|nr:STAS domain-containing protein [Acidobacteriota bacterium]NIM60340.1 STAS domain-containing protein [Acidobacteriota bacterium]NIO60341.1 STAS domain-containing protein [Acidobacteriota bacterium]NIQ31396.1 STAS domain-containing protein [Acidobacteriota bacterium]NIQ86622.1 STAS domain-containing protein [Acidobacteriota bacterium]